MHKLAMGISIMGLVACGGASAEDEARATRIEALTPAPAHGAELFAANCTVCHGDDGKSGSEQRDIVSEAKNEKLDAIEQVLAGGGSMPAFGEQLSDQDIADLIGYVQSL